MKVGKAGRKAAVRRRARRFTKPPTVVPAVIELHGLRLRFERGDLVVEHKPDPERPNVTVSRARARPAHARLLATHSITAQEHDAAEHYAELLERAAGAAGGTDALGVYVPGWQRGTPTQDQLDACEALREAHNLLGVRARVMVAMLVVGDMDVKDIAAQFAQNDQRTLGELAGALARCAELWGLAPVSRGPRRPQVRKRAQAA